MGKENVSYLRSFFTFYVNRRLLLTKFDKGVVVEWGKGMSLRKFGPGMNCEEEWWKEKIKWEKWME